jgi:hypothetical protein
MRLGCPSTRPVRAEPPGPSPDMPAQHTRGLELSPTVKMER